MTTSKKRSSTDSTDYSRVKLNPLAQYERLVRPNIRKKQEKLSNTDLIDDKIVFASKDHTFHLKEDKSNFNHSKLFDNNVRLLKSLTPHATKVFLQILMHLNFKCDTIELKPTSKTESGEPEMSRNTFNKAVAELCDKEIISRINSDTKSNEYWTFHINPQIFFRGDEKKFYRNVLNAHPEYTVQSLLQNPKKASKMDDTN